MRTGHYFWTVLAYDKNRHFRVVETSQSNIARFYIKPAPLFTIKMKKDELEKTAHVTLKNAGAVISGQRVSCANHGF